MLITLNIKCSLAKKLEKSQSRTRGDSGNIKKTLVLADDVLIKDTHNKKITDLIKNIEIHVEKVTINLSLK